MAETATLLQSSKRIFYRPAPRWHVWAALAGAVLIHLTAVAVAQRREPPPDLSQIPEATVEATLEPQQEATPPPEEIIAPPPPPEPEEIKPEFREEITPPPRIRPQKVVPIKAPPLSISRAKALAISAPRPTYPYEARARRVTGSGVCVVTVDAGSGAVTDATMAQSTGSPILDNSALSAFRNWRFRPGTVSKVRIPITYTLSGVSY